MWRYDVTNRTWEEVKASNHGTFELNYNMRVVVTDRNRVYFLGGSIGGDMAILSDSLFEWHLPSNTVTAKADLPREVVDPGVCYLNGYIYMVGGFIDLVEAFISNC
jgi:hypothetical protein